MPELTKEEFTDLLNGVWPDIRDLIIEHWEVYHNG